MPRIKWEDIKEICPKELNLFSASSLSSIELNLMKAEAMSRKGDVVRLRTDILEYLVKASKESARSCCEKATRMLKTMSEAYRKLGYRLLSAKTEVIEAKLTSRGLFGGSQIFGSTLFEVGLEFDPYLNLPIIPASAIKGAINSSWDALGLGEDGKREIFGEPERAGMCIFSDAYPIKPNREGFILYPDVMTPHYKDDALSELTERGEPREPTPIPYITVAPGVEFGFIIAVERNVPTAYYENLKKAFLFCLKMGLGAKTNVGYGVFQTTGLEFDLR